MICDSCKRDRLVNDFINNQNICYQCVYKEKLTKTLENRTEKLPKCRTCGKQVIHKKELKQRQRSVFCSQECALTGHKKLTKNYWCRKVPKVGDTYL